VPRCGDDLFLIRWVRTSVREGFKVPADFDCAGQRRMKSRFHTIDRQQQRVRIQPGHGSRH
jgi:hypothetical protein